MFNGHACAGPVERMVAARLLVCRGEAVHKLRAVVGQHRGSLDGQSELETVQSSTLLSLVMLPYRYMDTQ